VRSLLLGLALRLEPLIVSDRDFKIAEMRRSRGTMYRMHQFKSVYVTAEELLSDSVVACVVVL